MELQATIVPFPFNSSSFPSSPSHHHENKKQLLPIVEEVQDSFLKLQRLNSPHEGYCNGPDVAPQNSSPSWLAATMTKNVHSLATTSTSTFTNASYNNNDQRLLSLTSTGSGVSLNRFAYDKGNSFRSEALQPSMHSLASSGTTTIPQITPCFTTLQELIKKCGIKPATPLLMKPSGGKDVGATTIDPSTVRLLGKLQNLNEILQNLDESFTMTRNHLQVSNNSSSGTSKTSQVAATTIPPTTMVEDLSSCSTYVAKWLERCSPTTTSTASCIDVAAIDTQKGFGKLSFTDHHNIMLDPFLSTSSSCVVAPKVNPKPISRQDFKAQVEKLTGTLKKQQQRQPEIETTSATTNQLDVIENKTSMQATRGAQSFSSSFLPCMLMTPVAPPLPPPQKAKLVQQQETIVVDDPNLSLSSATSSSQQCANIDYIMNQLVETSESKSTSLLQQIVDKIALLEQQMTILPRSMVNLKRLKQRIHHQACELLE
ncbi:hypothetical protein CY35_15G083100 [Sphagnum magellanicum]|nr:hypothetical protein CY35_15G083100 [Sphagnum magellanicum]KAH9539950.1 hypothetical protein CY35_15G083100 [Sphagnum magellanicum]